jgi:hypothetical protein
MFPRGPHRMIAETDVDILEASTNHLDDVVRDGAHPRSRTFSHRKLHT